MDSVSSVLPRAAVVRCALKEGRVGVYEKLLAGQLRHPRGLGGRLVARGMNRGNARMNGAVVRSLAPAAHETLLDVGFGGGPTLEPLLAGCRQVCGTEMSQTLLARAHRRFKRPIARGRLRLEMAVVQALPFGDDHFDGVCSVNTLYFWPDLKAGLSEIHRVLKPGGRLCLGYRPARVLRTLPFTRHGFALWEDRELHAALDAAGFVHHSTQYADDDGLGYAALLAHSR